MDCLGISVGLRGDFILQTRFPLIWAWSALKREWALRLREWALSLTEWAWTDGMGS